MYGRLIFVAFFQVLVTHVIAEGFTQHTTTPDAWFYTSIECKNDDEGYSKNSKFDSKCHKLNGRTALGVAGDTNSNGATTGRCLFLFKDKNCGGEGVMRNIPYNAEATCHKFADSGDSYGSYWMSEVPCYRNLNGDPGISSASFNPNA